MRWLMAELDPGAVDRLAADLSLSRPIAAILCARGLADPAAARRFLDPTLDHLHPPAALRDMNLAVARIRRGIAAGEKIQIHGDYDVDGTTSTVVLKHAIEMAGGAVSYRIPHRLKDGYGMHARTVEQAAVDGVSLIISVDTGIRAGEVVRRASELGIDVIVTDHHLPEADLPPALAVINPNRADCQYPDKNLCGVGVAFKLAHGLLAALEWPQEKLYRVLESFLKMVAIGTVADVVPLTGENRVIVKHGLRGLRSIKNPGLSALLEVAGFVNGNVPSATQVAFRIAPRINAAGRMASADDVIELFLTKDAARARSLAEKLHVLNTERQGEEAHIVETIIAECEQTPVDDSQAALVFCAPKWHRGVLGIVASRLVDRFHRPVFVLSEEEGWAQGSGRSIAAFHLMNALEAMPELFAKFGGHSHAAGLTLASEHVATFRTRFNSYAAARLTVADFEPELAIDVSLAFGELGETFFQQLQWLAPFGAGNPAPVLAACHVEIAAPPSIMKEKHLRIPLRMDKRTLFFKAFHMAHLAPALHAGQRADVAFCVEEDTFNGGWSFILKDIKVR
jgi:single-stranded-DNA-specific exonuclease